MGWCAEGNHEPDKTDTRPVVKDRIALERLESAVIRQSPVWGLSLFACSQKGHLFSFFFCCRSWISYKYIGAWVCCVGVMPDRLDDWSRCSSMVVVTQTDICIPVTYWKESFRGRWVLGHWHKVIYMILYPLLGIYSFVLCIYYASSRV